jgi:hypothetical protein
MKMMNLQGNTLLQVIQKNLKEMIHLSIHNSSSMREEITANHLQIISIHPTIISSNNSNSNNHHHHRNTKAEDNDTHQNNLLQPPSLNLNNSLLNLHLNKTNKHLITQQPLQNNKQHQML